MQYFDSSSTKSVVFAFRTLNSANSTDRRHVKINDIAALLADAQAIAKLEQSTGAQVPAV